ncbi:unnamed protein product [Closterium sp. NIES-65]|nr:unnamed protein product [Closterium sp. NIES-65]
MAEVDQLPPLAEGDADADAADTRRSLKKGKKCKKGKMGKKCKKGKMGKKCKKGKKGKKNASKAAAPGGTAPGAETPADAGADSVGSDGAPGRSMAEVDQFPPLAEGDADADAADTRRSLKKGKKCKKGKKGKKCKKGKKGKKNASKGAAPGGTAPGAETPADAGADSVGSDGGARVRGRARRWRPSSCAMAGDAAAFAPFTSEAERRVHFMRLAIAQVHDSRYPSYCYHHSAIITSTRATTPCTANTPVACWFCSIPMPPFSPISTSVSSRFSPHTLPSSYPPRLLSSPLPFPFPPLTSSTGAQGAELLQCEGGILASEAIDLFRRFYKRGNPNGLSPLWPCSSPTTRCCFPTH